MSKSAELTKAIIKYLTLQGHYVVRINNIPGTKYRTGNVTKGVPDIMGCLKNGRAVGVEIKTTDRQSEFQKEFEAHYKSRGGIYVLAHSLEDVIGAGL